MSSLVAPRHDAEGSAGTPRTHGVLALALALRSAGLTVHLWSERPSPALNRPGFAGGRLV
jgi:hypothetical protein